MPSPPLMRGIRHVALLCSEIDKMERFYCDVLGYRVEWRPSEGELYLTCGQDNLALHARPAGGEPADGRETRLDHVGMLMERPDDVDAWAAYLKEKGIALDTLPRTHRDGARSFYLRDPEGNRLQFLYHPPLSDSR
jgi:catechol 2,3-dioxygenase-like lactoylglutathione lyase family enzyme